MARRSDWLLLGALGRIQRKLGRHTDGNRQMVDILNAVLDDGLDAVQAACTEALDAGLLSADVVLNALARAREPERQSRSGPKKGVRSKLSHDGRPWGVGVATREVVMSAPVRYPAGIGAIWNPQLPAVRFARCGVLFRRH